MIIKHLSDQTKEAGKAAKILLPATLVVALLALLLAGVAPANVRSTIPPDPYAPIYLDWYGDDEWVAFIFYRPPDCVPNDFNIFDFFHIPDAFFCIPLTVEGFASYKNPADNVPQQAKLTGLGEVPVWFVSRSDYIDAVQDGKLTFEELEVLPSLLKGHATFFKETRHVLGEHPVPKVNIVARGTLEDSPDYESFWFHAFWLVDGNINVNIDLE